ncbi:hypothetical protein AAVH_20473 [Aphelenchoides avenae]|nr:hypothetical protein AAVH_20473 [Aphelenchus avenae]
MSYTRVLLVLLQCLVLLLVAFPAVQSFVVFRLESAESRPALEEANEGRLSHALARRTATAPRYVSVVPLARRSAPLNHMLKQPILGFSRWWAQQADRE